MNILELIQQHSLIVRCLPHVVVSHWRLREGETPDLKENQTIVTRDGREYLREEKAVEKGGWWIIQRAAHTGATINFSLKKDYVAPTIEEAMQMFLDSLTD